MSKSRELKHFFSQSLLQSIAEEISRVYGQFPVGKFQKNCESLEELELKQRSTLICESLAQCLPPCFQEACDILLSSMGDPDPSDGLEGMGGFRYMPHL